MKHLSSAILDAYTEGSLDPAERPDHGEGPGGGDLGPMVCAS